MTITSPHNEKLKEIRKLRQRRRERERAGPFVAEGEDLLAAADAAGWAGARALLRRGQRPAGRSRSSRQLLASAPGSARGRGRWPSTRSAGRRRRVGPLCVYLHGVHDPGNVGAVLRCAQAFGASSRGDRPRHRRPVRAQGGAGEHGRGVRRPAGPRATRVEGFPGATSRWSPARAGRCDDGSSPLELDASAPRC